MLLGGCAASDDNKSNTPDIPAVESETDTAPVPDTPVETETPTATSGAATPTISSVKLVQDCPDAKANSMTKPSAPKTFAPSMPDAKKKRSKSKRKGDSAGGFRQPCTQSTVQLAFAGQTGASATVSVKEVRLLSTEGKALGTMTPRAPSIWKETGYEAWDGVLSPGADHKASYKLSLPDWSAVETALGGSSYGKMYQVEVDVEIDGTLTTLTSPQVERARPQIVKT
jgi:hypothetical protein